MEDHIEVVEYDASWPALYREELERLREAMPGASAFEHIGSTAVPGLAAKPTIDLMAGSDDLEVPDSAVRALERLGYRYLGEYGIPGRHFFRKGLPPSHHLHWVRRGGDFWTKQLVFRDYLLGHKEAARDYEKVKLALAKKFAHDRPSYTAAKTDVILRVQEQAWRWAGAALIVFDLEATCWEGGQIPEKMETIEIGAVRLDSELKPAGEYSALIRPKDLPTLSAFCTRLTGIGQAEVDGAPPFPEALRAFQSWIGPKLFRLGSWSAYDKRQLERDCARHGMVLPAPLDRHIDLRELHTRLRGWGAMTTAEALAREGLKQEGRAHRGLDDARSVGKLAAIVLRAMSEGRAA